MHRPPTLDPSRIFPDSAGLSKGEVEHASWAHVAIVGGALFVALACDKKSDAPAAGSGASTSSAPASSTTSTLQPIKYDKKKFPAKGSHATISMATKGGSGATRPNAGSKKLSEVGTDREMRKPATIDMVDCTTVPDNAAECDGANMYYCDDQKLWVVDCNAEAKFGGVASGGCFEADNFTECLGCDTADDGSAVCCDFEMKVCCDASGACYSPK
jgi:hypothetical protein